VLVCTEMATMCAKPVWRTVIPAQAVLIVSLVTVTEHLILLLVFVLLAFWKLLQMAQKTVVLVPMVAVPALTSTLVPVVSVATVSLIAHVLYVLLQSILLQANVWLVMKPALLAPMLTLALAAPLELSLRAELV